MPSAPEDGSSQTKPIIPREAARWLSLRLSSGGASRRPVGSTHPTLSYCASKNKKLWSVTVVPFAAVALMWQPRQPDGGVGPKAGTPGFARGKNSAGRVLKADAFVAASCT